MCVLSESENSYTLSCGVPVHPGKTPQKRNATSSLPTCAGEVAAVLGTVLQAVPRKVFPREVDEGI